MPRLWWVPQDGHQADRGLQRLEKFQPLPNEVAPHVRDAGDVASGLGVAGDESLLDWLAHVREHDGDLLRGVPDGLHEL